MTKESYGAVRMFLGPHRHAAVFRFPGGPGWTAIVDGTKGSYGWETLQGRFQTRKAAVRAVERVAAAYGGEG